MTAQKRTLFVIDFSLADYDSASDAIIINAKAGNSYGVSALAVHGLMEAVSREEFAEQVNSIDLVLPDGQPVRWALNSLCGAGLADRVAGPLLTLHVLEKAQQHGLGVYLFGSTRDTAEKFAGFIADNYPGVDVRGVQPDRFREATPAEDQADIDRINDSGAHIVLVGRGCPRQETWVAEHRGKVHCVMMAIGAAFDYHSGRIARPPEWMQRAGMEWLYRLIQEPGKLWKRYLLTNSAFIYRVTLAKLGLGRY
jgi:exopolysaccharide biosynthesis WecB/TagA/CpsF family protein